MGDGTFCRTKKPIWIAFLVLVCVYVFYFKYRIENENTPKSRLSPDVVEVTSRHSIIDQSDEYDVDTSEDQSQSSEEKDSEENPWYTDIDSQTEQTDTTTEPEMVNKKKLIQQAVSSDDVVETELLINKYYEHDVNGDKDFIPISSAAESCSVKVAEMLIQKGANANVVGGTGWCPIHIATYADCRPIVKMLIEHGADLSARIDLGYTALQIAKQDKRKNVIDLLENALESMGTGCSTEDASECIRTENSATDELEQDASEDQAQSSEERDTELYTDIVSQTDQMETTTEVAKKVDKNILHLIQDAIWKDDENKTVELINKYLEHDVNGYADFHPIHFAAYNCSVKVTEMLIQKGADVNLINEYGYSAIHEAAFSDCAPIAKMLVEHGSVLNAKSYSGQTALDIAIRHERKNVIDLLEKALEGMGTGCIAEDSSQCTTTEESATDELEQNASKDQSQSSEEQNTDLYTDVDSLTEQITTSQGEDLSYTDIVSQTDQMQTTTEMVEEIDPNIVLLIEDAIRNDDEMKTAELIKKFYNVDGDRMLRPISVAAESCSVKVAEMLIQIGADVNVAEWDGWRPIHDAASADCAPIVKMLIEHGADPNAKTNLGYTALRIAIESDYENVIDAIGTPSKEVDKQKLIERVIRKDDEIKTVELINKFYGQYVNGVGYFYPLSYAAFKCSVKVTEMLIEKGSDVNVAGTYGWRPIHQAASRNCRPVVKMLIEHGADLNATNDYGQTALSLATYYHHESVVDLLERMRTGCSTEDSSECTTTKASATDKLEQNASKDQSQSNEEQDTQ